MLNETLEIERKRNKDLQDAYQREYNEALTVMEGKQE